MKKPSKFMIERTKRTLAGRLVCRLFGDQTGAVLMEYVVLGVLLVAAVVGAVVMFGDEIKDALDLMGRAIFSPNKAREKHEEVIGEGGNIDQYKQRADAHQSAITDGQSGTGAAE